MKGGEETEVPRENPYKSTKIQPHTKVQRFKPQAKLEPAQ